MYNYKLKRRQKERTQVLWKQGFSFTATKNFSFRGCGKDRFQIAVDVAARPRNRHCQLYRGSQVWIGIDTIRVIAKRGLTTNKQVDKVDFGLSIARWRLFFLHSRNKPVLNYVESLIVPFSCNLVQVSPRAFAKWSSTVTKNESMFF